MKNTNIEFTVGKIINGDGCIRLLDAIYTQAINNYINGMEYAKKHSHGNDKYMSAVRFLKETDKGKRILKILENLTPEQAENLKRGGINIRTGRKNSRAGD